MYDIEEALNSIPVAEIDRDTWLKMGMGLNHEGIDVSVWDKWSQNDSRYHEGECYRLWEGFKRTNNPITGATIIKTAQGYGWNGGGGNISLEWDEEIEFDGDTEDAKSYSLKQPETSTYTESIEWNPTEQLKQYLQILFLPDEYVEYTTTDTWPDEDGKYRPGVGPYDRTAGELIAELEKHPDDIGAVIGDWKEEAGAWIQFNPVDGKGARKENVTRFSYALLECDDISKDEQIRLFREHKFPIRVMTDSGGKSVHAIVDVGAEDGREYDERIKYLYEYCDEHNIPIDHQNKNPNRKSRMPGVTRNGNRQYIIAMNIGMRTWADWVDYVEGNEDDLPAFDYIADYKERPKQREAIIDNILRQGHKMIITGGSKAGKSMLLLELSVCFAEGLKWLGFSCKKSKVMYINFEIDRESCMARQYDIYDAHGMERDRLRRIATWNLKGFARPLDQLLPSILKRCKNRDFGVIILDPIYKIITGDENSATDMAEFTNFIDVICAKTGCAVVYAHHHSKGAQGSKKSMDRGSGSGVFARDADAILDMTDLELSSEIKNMYPNDTLRAYRVESTLREFKDIVPVNIWYRYPIHVVDEEGLLDDMAPVGSAEAGRNKNNKCKTSEQTDEDFRMAFDLCNVNGRVTISDMSEYLEVGKNAVYERRKRLGKEYDLDHGYIVRRDLRDKN